MKNLFKIKKQNKRQKLKRTVMKEIIKEKERIIKIYEKLI